MKSLIKVAFNERLVLIHTLVDDNGVVVFSDQGVCDKDVTLDQINRWRGESVERYGLKIKQDADREALKPTLQALAVDLASQVQESLDTDVVASMLADIRAKEKAEADAQAAQNAPVNDASNPV